MDRQTLVLDVDRWLGDADAVDATVLGRCRPPVLDLGCGPGRMVRALTRSGRPALGIVMSAVAVQSSRIRGGPALRRLISDRLPAEGRWGTVLLMDSNLGIGGDVRALLRRCAELVRPYGLILCEVDSVPGRYEIAEVVLASRAASCPPMRWAGVGATKVIRVAADLGLVLEDQWTSGGRTFVALSTLPA
jgi:2-polyprenyl-3-methyl-5-hydroxy-6-metoxy-1,4-benzoquinol methylase